MSALAFELGPDLEAHEPPEARGLPRDGVRLLVARRQSGEISHHTFRELPDLIGPGDVLVINVSATIPAAVPAKRANGTRVRVHFATRAPHLEDDWRVVEIRSADGRRPARLPGGEQREPRGGATLGRGAPYPSGARAPSPPPPPSPPTAGRSATGTCAGPGRSTRIRTCMRRARAAPRCRAP